MAIKGTKNWKGRELKNGEESSKMEWWEMAKDSIFGRNKMNRIFVAHQQTSNYKI
jgi:hypothetical protein